MNYETEFVVRLTVNSDLPVADLEKDLSFLRSYLSHLRMPHYGLSSFRQPFWEAKLITRPVAKVTFRYCLMTLIVDWLQGFPRKKADSSSAKLRSRVDKHEVSFPSINSDIDI